MLLFGLSSTTAWATGTRAGTTISNQATLTFWTAGTGETSTNSNITTTRVDELIDIVHLDPDLDAGLLGQATHKDFQKICESVSKLEKGLWVNIGSAVLMPEVFLKAVSYARNVGRLTEDFTTANLDMIRMYRAMTNVVCRPPKVGLNIVGQHEILLPLLHQALISDSPDSAAPMSDTTKDPT